MIDTYLTYYAQNTDYLDDCLWLLERYYPFPVLARPSRDGEKKSDQLIRLLESLTCSYLVLLEEDFYFVQPTSAELLETIFEFCEQNKVDRFSLQSTRAYAQSSWNPTELECAGRAVYSPPRSVQCVVSLEASVWKRQFLLSLLKTGWSDQVIELTCSDTIREELEEYKIFAFGTEVLHYRDAMRRGNRIISLERSPVPKLTVSPDDTSALYPIAESRRELLLP